MGRLNRQKCDQLVTEFADYCESEKGVELAPDGERLIRTFCESLRADDAVRKRFDDLLKDEGESEREPSRGPRNSLNSHEKVKGKDASRQNGGYPGEERRKNAGGFHLWERRKVSR
jgi:hypothetical protein